ncbi:MAG: translation initiation factor IF-2 [bacterium]
MGLGGASARSRRARAKPQLTTPAAHKRVVRINETISVGELGKAIGVKLNELIRKLMQMGVMATANQQLDLDTATLIASEYDYDVKNVAFQEDAVLSGPADVEAVADDPDAVPRAPVVTIMGHVDHGKTTLLDRIRKANVASGEAGGITQHVGAYRVEVGDRAVVFLDTPGHAAFTAMRARGASVTDVVVLVVAADDGIMPQTVESINHAKAAGVPIVVAINKMDKPGVDPERLKQELTKYELVPDEWGGDTFFVPVSALTGAGIPDLLETLALQSDVLELKANPKKPAFGRVVESRIEKGRGTVVTVLIQEGTLSRSDFVVAGQNFGRVRTMFDSRGKQLKSAGPSTPVEVLGLDGVPSAGDAFYVVANEKDAKRVIASRSDKARAEREAELNKPASMADLLASMGKKEKEVQNLILKTDVSGSLEAIRTSLEQIGNEEVEVRIIHAAVGNISESDITLATASDAIVLGFNVGPDAMAKRAADQATVQIRQFSVIYDVIDAVKEMLSGLLTPETVETVIGHAEVRAVFHIQRVGTVAGCMVTDGKVQRNVQGRIMRAGKKLHEGKITTLKRFKDDVREVTHGFECGLSVDGYKTIEVGDIVEVFEVRRSGARSTDRAPGSCEHAASRRVLAGRVAPAPMPGLAGRVRSHPDEVAHGPFPPHSSRSRRLRRSRGGRPHLDLRDQGSARRRGHDLGSRGDRRSPGGPRLLPCGWRAPARRRGPRRAGAGVGLHPPGHRRAGAAAADAPPRLPPRRFAGVRVAHRGPPGRARPRSARPISDGGGERATTRATRARAISTTRAISTMIPTSMT